MKAIVFAAFAAFGMVYAPLAAHAQALKPQEARDIAKDAVIYGVPLLENYRVLHSYFVDRDSPEFKAPWNRLNNVARVFTPDDKAIQTPNSDTPYSQLGADLRAEPLVITVPEVDAKRYYSLQFIDLYTYNFAYVGSRATGNGAGHFLLAGPRWKGKTPKGIKGVIRSETDLNFILYRTQLFDAADLDNVKTVQAGYKVQPLSQFLGQKPRTAATIKFMRPLTPAEQRSSLDFFPLLNFILQFGPTHPSEKALMARFAKLNIGAGKIFDPDKLSPQMRKAIQDGMADAWKAFAEFKANEVDSGKRPASEGFGTRAFLKNDYMARMSAAVLGIYGNSKEEALYPAYFTDADGQKLSGDNRYILRLAPGQIPPVHSFWSLTMYELPASLLYANPLKRYLINSPMLDSLKRDADGGITLYIQNESPGPEKESNWLPAPKGPFWTTMRLYWPKAEALDGRWTQPALQRVVAQTDAPAPKSVEAAKPTEPAEPAKPAEPKPAEAKPADAATPVPSNIVTQANYCRAETDRTFFNGAKIAGGVNKWLYFRNVTPLDKQTVIRMNKDTLYASILVDTSKGATLTIPQMPAGRYFSVLVVDNDHYAPVVYYEPGTYDLPRDTKYISLLMRIRVNADDPADVALVNSLQDLFVVKAASADAFPEPQWDKASLAERTAEYNAGMAKFDKYPDDWMGPRGTVNDNTRHLACAGGWGLFPNKDALYVNYNAKLPADKCYTATYKVPDNKGFWSITLYGEDGYMKHGNAVLNEFNTKMNPDGTFTAYFGAKEVCGDVANRVDIDNGWNFLMRIYRPGPSVLSGEYKLPGVVEKTP